MDRISVHLLGRRRGLVWNAQSALVLRRDFGIVGAMIGHPPRSLGSSRVLPLELAPEEVYLCLKRGYCRLFAQTPSSAHPSQPSPSMSKSLNSLGATTTTTTTNNNNNSKRKREDKLGGKEERSDDDDDDDDDDDGQQRPGGAKKNTKGGGSSSGGGGGGVEYVSYPYDIKSINALADSKKVVIVPRLRNAREKQLADQGGGDQVSRPVVGEEVTLDKWDFPSDEAERVRCLVYEDLHNRGYRITGGCKFGADYLAYPDDPLRFHATMSVRVVTDWCEPFHARALSGFLRCSHAARKHAVYAGVEPSDDDASAGTRVVYLTGMPDGGFAGVAAAAEAGKVEEDADGDDDDDDDGGGGDQQTNTTNNVVVL
ncbi:tRNA-splicing endonuclease subunit SEN34 [Pycnococcus provasolii]